VTTGGRHDVRGGGPPDGDELIELLYGELPPDEERAVRARVAGDPNLSAQLSELERVRELVRALPEEEPPPAISAQLLAHAAQAAQRRGGTAPAVAPGFWSRVRSWFQPIIAHPGLAAACSVVLVAGVAGVLVLRQGDELTSATRSAEPEPEAGLGSPGDPDVTTPGTSAAPPPAAESAPSGVAGGAGADVERDEAPVEAPTDEPSGAASSTDKTRTSRRPRAYRLPDGKDARREEDRAKQDAPGPRGGALGMTEEKAPLKPTDDADESSAAAGRAEEAEQQQGAEATAEPAPPPATAPAAPQPSQTTADPSGEARTLHEQAVKAAAARRCLEVQSLDQKIRSIDPAYHERQVLRDRRLAVCLSANKPARSQRK
jgi:anti-sigma factor RsiW